MTRLLVTNGRTIVAPGIVKSLRVLFDSVRARNVANRLRRTCVAPVWSSEDFRKSDKQIFCPVCNGAALKSIYGPFILTNKSKCESILFHFKPPCLLSNSKFGNLDEKLIINKRFKKKKGPHLSHVCFIFDKNNFILCCLFIIRIIILFIY